MFAGKRSIQLVDPTRGDEPLPAAGLPLPAEPAQIHRHRVIVTHRVIKGRGIRVNVLSPGPTDTPGLRGVAPAGQEQALGFAAQVPLGRVAVPDEIAQAAVFLASDASSFVNGIEFFVDGGQAQI